MAEALRFATIVERQVRLLQQLCDTLTSRAISGTREDLDNLFIAQGHLEHWLQYLTPLALDVDSQGLDAPPPVMRPAPPLPHEEEEFYGRTRVATSVPEDDILEESQRPRVSFPPEPLWVEDLERGPGEPEV